MLRSGERILCAVSGGADSMCLLHWLCTNAPQLGISVCAAHFEHGIRGEESLADARFVEDKCRRLGIEYRIGSADVPAYAARHGLGTEEAARKLRYDFLEKTADELSCDSIATAHNADDNAETVLFNLARGAGSTGLRGIPPVRGRIIRPLLSTTRTEIEAYLNENGISHVEDSTNASDAYSRNLIRHRVTPILRQINPAFAMAVSQSSQLLREDDACLCQMAEEFIEQELSDGGIDCEKLMRLPRAVSSRVVRRLCPRAMGMEHVEAVLRLCEAEGLAYADVPGLRVRAEQGRIYFSEQEHIQLPERRLIPGQILEIPEAGLMIYSEFTVRTSHVNDLFKTLDFKSGNICGSIVVTGRRPGDKVRPAGRGCTKSLKSLFTEAGMTQQQRDMTPVLRDERGIMAVYGLACDERFAAQPGDRVLRIEYRLSGRK